MVQNCIEFCQSLALAIRMILRQFFRFSVPILALLLGACHSPMGDTRHRLIVSVTQQRMGVLRDGAPLAVFPVSTSKFGLGDFPNSNFTPLGRMRIAEKIGGGQPSGMRFKDRLPTGEIVPVNAHGRDPIVSRIMWLEGLESQNANAYHRYIYIHGTPEERFLGSRMSYGCVRMASRDIVWLYDQIGTGARVDILPGPLPPIGQLPP
jgi:lipoprotein-anchoring transpeptidase ErfK/SrfK